MANLPTRNNNPGDLKDPSTGTFRTFATPQEGYAALLNDLQSKMTGATSTGLGPSSNLVDFAKVYAPASDNNNPGQYAANLANKLGVRPDATLSSLQPKIGQLADAIAGNEGYQSQSSQKSGVMGLQPPVQPPPIQVTPATATQPPVQGGLPNSQGTVPAGYTPGSAGQPIGQNTGGSVLSNMWQNAQAVPSQLGNLLSSFAHGQTAQDITAALPGSVTGVGNVSPDLALQGTSVGAGQQGINQTNQQNAQSDTAFIQAMNAKIKAGQSLTAQQQAVYNSVAQRSAQPTTAADLTPAINRSDEQVLGDFAQTGANLVGAGGLESGLAETVGQKGLVQGLINGGIEGAKQGSIALGAQGLASGLLNNQTPVGVAASTAIGAGEGAVGGGLAGSLIGGATAVGPSVQEKVLGLLSPQSTKAEMRLAMKEGRLVQPSGSSIANTIFGQGGTEILPGKKTVQTANTIAQEIPGAGSMNAPQLYSAMGTYIEDTSQDLESEMSQVPISQDLVDKSNKAVYDLQQKQLSRTPKLEEPNVIKRQQQFQQLMQSINKNDVGDIVTSARNGEITTAQLQQQMQQRTSKIEEASLNDIWNARKEYDNSISPRVKNANTLSSDEVLREQQEWLENRKVLNDLINDAQSGLGKTSRIAFSKMSDMYNGQQALLKNVKNVKPTGGLVGFAKNELYKYVIPTAISSIAGGGYAAHLIDQALSNSGR